LADHPEEGAGINQATKYVASNTLTTHEWKKSIFLKGNVVVDEIKKLSNKMGGYPGAWERQPHPDVIEAPNLVDEFWLKNIR